MLAASTDRRGFRRAPAVGRGQPRSQVEWRQRVYRQGVRTRGSSLLEISVGDAEVHRQVLWRKWKDLGDHPGRSAKGGNGLAIWKEFRFRVGANVDDVLPGACAPFVGSDGREDTHHGACDAARFVAAEAGNERQRRRESEQKVTMASVLGGFVVGERRVLGCEPPRPADTHSRGTVDG